MPQTMPNHDDLNSVIFAAQNEVENWHKRSRLAMHGRRAGSRWPLVLCVWAGLGLALYTQRHTLVELVRPQSTAQVVSELGDVLEHAADDIELYRAQYRGLPERLPIDFLHGVIDYRPDGDDYVLEASYHGATLRLRGDRSGPGTLEVVSR